MQDLKVTVIQSDIVWENVQENLRHFGMLIDGISGDPDLILLPETFNTGFSINPERCAEPMDGPSVRFLSDCAVRRNAAVMATLLIREKDRVFNRLLFVRPDGMTGIYDKRHLFRMSDEFRLISRGNTRPLFNWKGWNIAPMICYDLRFPVWNRNTWSDGRYGYDLLVCLANWPGSRAHVWKNLLVARALENQACVAGVNRIGKDGAGTDHSGDSMAVDARGTLIGQAAANTPDIFTVSFSHDELTRFRDSFTVGMDWDRFTIVEEA